MGIRRESIDIADDYKVETDGESMWVECRRCPGRTVHEALWPHRDSISIGAILRSINVHESEAH